MVAITCKSLTKYYGVDLIFKDLSFQVESNDRIGLIGNNGTGKSTLFKILSNKLEYDAGDIHIPPSLTIDYLEQNGEAEPQRTLWDHCLPIFKETLELEQTLKETEQQIADQSQHNSNEFNNLLERYNQMLETFESMDGYSYKSRIRGILFGLGFMEDDFSRLVGTLSGGQKSRLNIAKLLLKNPDILMLDEPTNHLDIDSVAWLETYLKQYKGTVIVVTHDRYFLDQVCNRIFEIYNHEMFSYDGTYSQYINYRESILENRLLTFEKQQTEIKRQEEIIRRFKGHGTEKLAKRARSREKSLDRIERVEKPIFVHEEATIRFKTNIKSGRDVLNAESLAKEFDGKLIFENANLEIFREEKIGLIGPNGVGKTTLFKILMGEMEPSSGIFELGHNVEVGYFDQNQSNLNDSNNLFEEILETDTPLSDTEIRTYLGSFLFKNDDVFKSISDLSGGEKSRVAILKLVLSNSNFLFLDEPTNHLDIQSKEILENALCNYNGTLLAISHDRYFLNRVCNKIIEMKADGTLVYHGNYAYYKEKKAEEESLLIDDEVTKTKTQIRDERKKEKELSKLQTEAKKRVELVEKDIQLLEAKLIELEAHMCDPEVYSNPDKSKDIHSEVDSIRSTLEKLYVDWETLME